MFPVPTSFFLTHGVGMHRDQLTAFELALRDADIEQQNLVTVSSILPPQCVELTREAGVATLRPGEITFCVMARTETNEPGRRIHSSIGLARPSDTKMYGYISEQHGYGMTAEQSGDYAEDLAASMLASTLGIEFDPNAAWDERKKVYQTSNLIFGSTSITAAAIGDDAGRWTCAIAAAVFRFAERSDGRRPDLRDCRRAFSAIARAGATRSFHIAGIPFDIGTTNRSGARFGPPAIRAGEPHAGGRRSSALVDRSGRPARRRYRRLRHCARRYRKTVSR